MNEQTQTNDTFLHYVGHFIGSQPKNSGTKKDGTLWQSHDIMFHHGDMTKPIRFTWFNDPNRFQPQTLYRVMYKMNDFVNKDGIACKSKQALKIEPSNGEVLGYQQQVYNAQQNIPQPPNNSTSPQTGVMARVPQSISNQALSEFDVKGFIDWYTGTDQISVEHKNVTDFVGRFIKNSNKELYKKLEELYNTAYAPVKPVEGFS